MIGKMSKEELAVLTILVDGYNLTRNPIYLDKIHQNIKRLEEAITQSRQYLEELKSTGGENGLKLYTENFLKSCKRFTKLTRNQEKMGVLEKKMGVLENMDEFSSPYSVSERSKRNS